MSADLCSGLVVTYPYLWRWQRDRGETEGRKERPVCVALAVYDPKNETTHLALLAISSRPPGSGGRAIEVPEIECRRGGLSEFKQAWVTVSEYNYDIAERSFYLEQAEAGLGRFSKSFMMRLAAEIAPLFRARRGRVDRTD